MSEVSIESKQQLGGKPGLAVSKEAFLFAGGCIVTGLAWRLSVDLE